MGKPKTHTIVISATIKKPHPLTISSGSKISTTEDGDEKFTTMVSPGDIVIWSIAPGCAISSIDTVQKKINHPPNPKNKNLFHNFPGIGSTATKTATINNSKPGQFQDYLIWYTMTDGTQLSQDPRLQMNN